MLCQEGSLSWRKELYLFGPAAQPLGVVAIQDNGKCSSQRIPVSLLSDDGVVMLRKLKFFVGMTVVRVMRVSEFGAINGGSRLMIAWQRD
jgi:hypothetical protein